jgi:hypothetical protein
MEVNTQYQDDSSSITFLMIFVGWQGCDYVYMGAMTFGRKVDTDFDGYSQVWKLGKLNLLHSKYLFGSK